MWWTSGRRECELQIAVDFYENAHKMRWLPNTHIPRRLAGAAWRHASEVRSGGGQNAPDDLHHPVLFSNANLHYNKCNANMNE
jgi:hypothetical protein